MLQEFGCIAKPIGLGSSPHNDLWFYRPVACKWQSPLLHHLQATTRPIGLAVASSWYRPLVAEGHHRGYLELHHYATFAVTRRHPFAWICGVLVAWRNLWFPLGTFGYICEIEGPHFWKATCGAAQRAGFRSVISGKRFLSGKPRFLRLPARPLLPLRSTWWLSQISADSARASAKMG